MISFLSGCDQDQISGIGYCHQTIGTLEFWCQFL